MTEPPADSRRLQERLEKLQAEYQTLQQTLQDILQAQSNFVSIVSHEVRVPLTAIKGYTDLLRQGAVGEINAQQREFLDVIAKNTERMSALVSALVDLARLENGEMRMSRAAIPAESALQQAAGSMEQAFREKKLELALVLPPGLPPIMADAGRLQQVLQILLDNAACYTGPGGQVILQAMEFEGSLRLEISDSGIGITTEDQLQLFDAFFRSEDPRVREQQGWGLGLSLAQGLVEKMGGEIGVRSKPGEGAAFWLTLPTA